MLQFPPELIARILDFLHDDQAALRSSCLVHTWWISPSRHHLFASVDFHKLFDLELWVNSFPSVPHSPARNVRNISIAGLWASLGEGEFNPNELEGPVLEGFRSFNRVSKLLLTLLNLHTTSSPEIHFSHFHSSLTSLELYSPYPTTPRKLLQFICSFPRLENLLITGLSHWVEESEGDLPRLRTSPPLGGSFKLVGSCDPSGEFMDSLVDLPNGVSFRSINLDLVLPEDYRSVGRLVKSCATTLETLRIGGAFAEMPKKTGSGISALDVLDLRHNHVIRELDLTIAAIKQFSCSVVEALLASIASPNTTVVTVRISFSLPFTIASGFKSNDWDSLDSILTSETNRGVSITTTVEFSHGLYRDLPVWQRLTSLVESVLPQLTARGLVTGGGSR